MVIIMRIDKSNGDIINSEVYIHDDIFNNLLYDKKTSTLKFSLSKSNDYESMYEINYINVVAFEMTSCDYWGESPHILDFEYVEYSNCKLLPKLYEEQKKMPYNPECKLIYKKEYIETIVTFTSGDQMIVVCEYIDI